MTARGLVDGRDLPACRALGRSWWQRYGRTLTFVVNPLRSSVPVPAPGSPSPGGDRPAAASTAGARGIVAFVRARLDDLRATADRYHRFGCATGIEFPRRACDCDEPNRRRRRAFTHGNLLDWAEQATAVCDADGYNLDPTAVLRHLAAEWSDHPDYDTEWGPLP